MLYSACDICKNIIKIGEKKTILAVNEIEEVEAKRGELQQNFMDRIYKLQEYQKNVRVFELCKNCRKVLDHLLKMRREEVQKILKEIENSYNSEE